MTTKVSSPDAVAITVDSKEYNVNTQKMPYFKPLGPSENETSTFKHFDVAYQCVEEGFHCAFKQLGSDLSAYPSLCSTLKRLGVDMGSCAVADIIQDIKCFKHRYDYDDGDYYEEDRFDWLGSYKSKGTPLSNRAEASTFKLLYVHYESTINYRDRNSVFEVVVYIISHRSMFNHITRNVVREAFKTMQPTVKQLAVIDKWPVYGSDGEPVLDPDSEYEDYVYGSSDEDTTMYGIPDWSDDDDYSTWDCY